MIFAFARPRNRLLFKSGRRLFRTGTSNRAPTTQTTNNGTRTIIRSPTTKSKHALTATSSSAIIRASPNKTNTRHKAANSTNNLSTTNAPKTHGRDDDSLSRFPNLHSAGGILRLLDYSGTVTFALSGSITAAQSGLDVFGCSMVAMITAVGGGTIRDAVFLSRRPFWTIETEYIWMSVLTGFVTFFTWPRVMEWNDGRKVKAQLREDADKRVPNKDSTESSDTNTIASNNTEGFHYDEFDAVMDTFDAIALSAFAIIGAQNGVRAGMPTPVSAICGMATSTFGGMTRDVVCGRPVRIVHSNAEVYAQPALAGAVVYLITAAKGMRLSPSARIGSAMLVCLGSRYVAVKHDVKLHTWEMDEDDDGLGVAVRK